MYNLLARKMLLPLLDLLEGPNVPKYIRELEETQWWPPDRIRELQNQKLQKLISHAYNNVGYYKSIFDERGLKPEDVKDSADLVKLPILTKQIIREKFPQLVARGFPMNKAWPSHTGGSTGEPMEFYSTFDQLRWATATFRRAEKWWGHGFGDRRVTISVRRPFMSKLRKLERLAGRTTVFLVEEMLTDVLPLFVRKLEKIRPRFVTGYPSAVYLLAHFIESSGRKLGFRPEAIVTGGEQLYDYQRELFTRVFGCSTYSCYGSYEMNQMAQECPEHAGFHIAAESVVIEIVDDNDCPLPAGKEGRVVATNLHNYVMPFIRYDMGDMGALADKICPCGRGLPLLERLSGRTTDFIITRNGNKVSGLALPWNFLSTNDIEQFQIVQEKRGEVVVKFIPQKGLDSDYKESMAVQLRAKYQNILGKDMEIRVEFVDRIPTTRDGKRRIVESKLHD